MQIGLVPWGGGVGKSGCVQTGGLFHGTWLRIFGLSSVCSGGVEGGFRGSGIGRG